MSIPFLNDVNLTGNAIVNVKDPVADSDAATKGWAKSRANHTGSQTASTISDFDTQVRTNRLDQLAAPTVDLSANGHKITNLANGTATTDAVNKGQLDAAIQGVSSKQVARLATTEALPDCTYANGSSGVGATLTGDSNGALTDIDGETPDTGDLLLVKNEDASETNGLYTVTQSGDGSNPFILTRSTQMDQASEMNALVAVEFGTANANTLWLSNASDTFTVGTDDLLFVQLNSSTSATAGEGISIVGNEISVDLGAGLTFDGSDQITLDATVAVLKYSAAVGNGSDTTIVVTHNLGTRDVLVSVRQAASPYAQVIVENEATDTNTVTLKFATAPTSGQYRVLIQG